MNQTPPEHVKKSGILYTLDGWHREFDYVTACYLLEPWERRIVKVTLLVLIFMMLLSAFFFLSAAYTSIV